MAPTPTAQVRIRVPPPPAHLRNPHLWEDALYETAAWSCLEAAISRGPGEVRFNIRTTNLCF